jgi:hemerythrin-like metal-binding protein
MAFIEWTSEFETGIERIDQQHKTLVEIVNKFDEATRRGKGSQIMTEILCDLVGYTSEHFADEERLMEEVEYPKFKHHQNQHRQLLQKVERLQFEFDQQGKRITSEVREFLKNWLINHILKDDMAYVPSMVEKVNS